MLTMIKTPEFSKALNEQLINIVNASRDTPYPIFKKFSLKKKNRLLSNVEKELNDPIFQDIYLSKNRRDIVKKLRSPEGKHNLRQNLRDVEQKNSYSYKKSLTSMSA